MTKITARHRAPLTHRGRLTRLWSTVSALPVGALAGCVAVGAAAATSSPEVGALGLGVAMAPAALTSWRSRFTEPAAGHGRRSVRAAARPDGQDTAASVAGRQVERTLAPRPAAVSLASLLEAPRAAPATAAALAPAASEVAAPRPSGRRSATSPFGPVAAGTVTAGAVAAAPVAAGRSTMLALGTTRPAARTPIVLDVPDLAALHAATGQEHVWHGRSATRPEDDPSRLFTVSSSGGAVEVVVLTRAERAARDLEALSAMAAAEEASEDVDEAAAPETAPAVMVRLPGGRAAARGRRRAAEDDGLASAA